MMTPPPPPARKNLLGCYHELAEHISSKRPPITTIVEMVQSAVETHPLSFDNIEQLRREAEDQTWYAPRHAWSLAQIAYIAARDFHHALLSAERKLTLGVSLNALGEYADTIRTHLLRSLDAAPMHGTARRFS